MEDRTLLEGAADGSSRFGLAPPRRFVLPAVLLLLSEQPGYGYALAARFQELHLGQLDRPAVYRALAQLEGDGLIESAEVGAAPRQARRVYQITSIGERVLRTWMAVVKEEHDQLGHVLRRYQATGRADAVLAEVEGGWAAALGYGWSPVASTSPPRRPMTAIDPASPPAPPGAAASDGPVADGHRRRCRYELIPERSVVLVEVRSTVGPLSFGSVGVTGSIEADVAQGQLLPGRPPAARLVIDVAGLRSGNRLHDAELMRRIDARLFPSATVELDRCTRAGPGNLYQLEGQLTFHGVTRPAQGTVSVETLADDALQVTGEQVFDIRDFAVASPTVLMLRIYPDVRVRLHIEAQPQENL